MSTNISLGSPLVVNGVGPTTPTHQDAAAKEFSGAMNAATGGNSSSLQANGNIPQEIEALPTNMPEARLLTNQSNTAIDIMNVSKPEQYGLVLASLTEKAELLPGSTQTAVSSYGQSELDVLTLERSFLMFMQFVQEGNTEEARLALRKLRKRFRTGYFGRAGEEVSDDDSIDELMEELDAALVTNDLHAAQLSINSFLARLGHSQGNFFSMSV